MLITHTVLNKRKLMSAMTSLIGRVIFRQNSIFITLNFAGMCSKGILEVVSDVLVDDV